jgi:hypothetical protein
MAPKDRKGKGKGKGHRAALSLDSSFGNLSLASKAPEAKSPAVSYEVRLIPLFRFTFSNSLAGKH